MTSHGGFCWPDSGPVSAPDWQPTAECGNGLHGFLWGEGDGSLANWSEDARWLVVSVQAETIIDLGGKVKFPSGEVVYVGDRKDATDFLRDNGGLGRLIIGSTITGGDGSTITGGDGSTITGGDGSTITGGYGSTITGGNGSTITGGNRSTITGGDGSTIVISYWDQKSSRMRAVTGYVGEDGVFPGMAYCVKGGKLHPVNDREATHTTA
jgi:hypothetical protein